MNMKKRIFALLLTVAMLVSVLTSCNEPKEPEQTSSSIEETTPSTPEIPEIPPQKITCVNITCGTGVIESFAAAELKWYLAQKNVTFAEDGFGIDLRIDATVAQKDGYKIVADEDGLVITGGNERGLAYGLYGFLEQFVGVHFYSPDTVVVDEADVLIGSGVLDEFKPAFEILGNPWAPIQNLPEKDGGNDDGDRTDKTLSISSITSYVSPDQQPCLTDAQEVRRAIEFVKDYLSKNPGTTTLTFLPSNVDGTTCQCDTCVAINTEEGSLAGTFIRFLNTIIDAVTPTYPDLIFKTEISAFLQVAPKVTKPAQNLVLCFSTESCHVTHPINDTNCPASAAFVESLTGWAAIGYVELEYMLTATTNYIPTFANLGTLRENMRFFAESGVDALYCSGNLVCPSGEFSELRVYLVSKLLLDPMMSEEEFSNHMDNFLAAFYGAGWTSIRSYINITTRLAANGGFEYNPADGTTGQAVCGQGYGDHPFTAITKQEYYDYMLLFDEDWAIAEELAGDRANYVKHAAYQWRYIKLCINPNAEDAKALIADVTGPTGKVSWREKQWNVDETKSDLTLAPTEWEYKS